MDRGEEPRGETPARVCSTTHVMHTIPLKCAYAAHRRRCINLMRRNRSFHADIGRAVTAAVAAEQCEDIDAALSEAVNILDSLSVRQVDPEKLRFDALIGMGGYGSVWVCTDPESGSKFALKMLRKGLLAMKPDLPK